MFAFGGNGPLLAAQIANELKMTRILVPHHAGVFSAYGLLTGNVSHEFSQALVESFSTLAPSTVVESFQTLENRGALALQNDGYARETLHMHRTADFRYSGQAYELSVSVDDGPITKDTLEAALRRFHNEHSRTYGHASPDDPVELVNLRVEMGPPVRAELRYGEDWLNHGTFETATTGGRVAYFGKSFGSATVPVLNRSALNIGVHQGPLIIEEIESTCVVPPGWTATLDQFGNIILETNHD
jgi:N-methylhydantoinase A